MRKRKPTKNDFLLAWAQALPEGAHFGPAIWDALGGTARRVPREIVEWMENTKDARKNS